MCRHSGERDTQAYTVRRDREGIKNVAATYFVGVSWALLALSHIVQGGVRLT